MQICIGRIAPGNHAFGIVKRAQSRRRPVQDPQSWQRIGSAPPFKGMGVDVFDAETDRGALQESFEKAPCKRKTIEIKRNALSTRRRRPFTRKIEALVTFSTTAPPIVRNVASF
jgi:hypothetical protein